MGRGASAGVGRRRRRAAYNRTPAPRHLKNGRVAAILGQYLGRRLLATTLVLAVFIMGLIFGAAGTEVLSQNQRSDLANSLEQFVLGAKENDLGDPSMVARSLVYENSVKTIGLFWLLGLSVIGAPLVLVLLFSKGFALGFSVGFLVESFSGKGFLLALASVVPHNLLMVPAILVAAVASLSVSGNLASRRFHSQAVAERRGTAAEEVVAFTALSAAAAVVLAVGALVQGYVTPFLISLAARATG